MQEKGCLKNIKRLWYYIMFFFELQKYKEYLNGSNLIVKLQAKHDLLKQTLGEGENIKTFFCVLDICREVRSIVIQRQTNGYGNSLPSQSTYYPVGLVIIGIGVDL